MTNHVAPNHGERAHAILSASSSDRWLHCPGSVALCEQLPDSSSEAAAWGTVGHELGELALRHRFLGEQVDFRQTVEVVDLDSFEVRKVSKFDAEHFEVVAVYRDYVTSLIAKYGNGEQPIVLIEKRLKYRRWAPRGFGTGDCILVFPRQRLAVVVDLKCGEGVLVYPEQNTQLMLYGAGTLDLLDGIIDIDRLVLSICQPRRDNLSEWEISTAELVAWLDAIVPVAEEAFSGSTRLVAGPHCKFCRAEVGCPERARLALESYSSGCAPGFITLEQLAEMLPKLDLIKSWVAALQKYAQGLALADGKIPGYKLVAGRAYRAWTDVDAVAAKLRESGLSEDEIWNKKLIGLTDVEARLGKRHPVFELTSKPEGAPTLVPEADKRAEWRSDTKILANFDD